MKIRLKNYPYFDYSNGTEVFAATPEQKFHAMRFIRDILLKECDWVVMPDSPISSDAKAEWITWRQWMRDITTHIPVVNNDYVEIPNPPSAGCPASWVNVDHDFITQQENHSH